ncbi:MAG: hypothetical protein WBP26_04020 [Candidatus Saccharimonadales bacterium]
MSDFESVSIEQFPGFLQNFAVAQGGEEYASEATDGIELRRGVVRQGGLVRSFVSFQADRQRECPNADISNIDYTLEQGITTKLDIFPDAVNEELVMIEEEYDPADGIWHESLQTLIFSTRDHNGGTLCVTNNYRYGVANHVLLEVPVIGGKPVFMEPEEMDPPAGMARTAEHGGIWLLECVQDTPLGAVVTELVDPFEIMMRSMVGETNKVQEYIRQMVGMVAALQPR